MPVVNLAARLAHMMMEAHVACLLATTRRADSAARARLRRAAGFPGAGALASAPHSAPGTLSEAQLNASAPAEALQGCSLATAL
eukprot:15449334-Alexandrium_andersonii.AAC.1